MPDAGRAMSRSFSLYLDALRLGAALTVLAAHAVWHAAPGQRWWPDSLGHNAVIVFFLLSGYVIAYVADHKERDARSFWVSRFARIYSVAVPALLLTLLADRIGLALDPAYYEPGLTTHDHLWVRLAASLVFANELWLVSIMPFSNSPYWSLCYEMAYYLLFSLWVFGGARRAWWVALAALVIGPKILLLAPIWWFGVLVYRYRPWYGIGEGTGWALWAGSALAVVLFQAFDIGAVLSQVTHGVIGEWLYVRLHFSKHFVGDYLLALLIAAHFVGFRRVAGRFAGALDAVSRPLRQAAGLTFSIYLFHLPLVFVAAILLKPLPPGGFKFALLIAAVLAVIVPLGLLTEHRKDDLRRWLARVLPAGRDAAALPLNKELPHA